MLFIAYTVVIVLVDTTYAISTNIYILPHNTVVSRVSSPVLTLHTAITHLIEALELQSLM